MFLSNPHPFQRVCLSLLLSLGLAEIQARTVRSHTLKEALELLEKQGAPWNSLRAEQAESEAEGAKSLALRNPEVSFAREDLSEGGTKVREWTVSIRKDFATPGVFLNRRAAQRHRSDALKSEFTRRREEARGELRQTYLEAGLMREEGLALQSLTGLVDAMVKAGQARFEEQSITSFEMFRLSSAQARVRDLEGRTHNDYSTLKRRLAAWLYPEGGVTEVEPADKPFFHPSTLNSAGLFQDMEHGESQAGEPGERGGGGADLVHAEVRAFHGIQGPSGRHGDLLRRPSDLAL